MVRQDGQARTCGKRKTPLRGSGDTFAIALKGSLNSYARRSFRSTHGNVEQNPATVALMMTMIELTIAENTT
jgi:hypothetical protein